MVQALRCFLSSRVKDENASLLLTAAPSAPCHLNRACEERRNNPSRFFAGGKIKVGLEQGLTLILARTQAENMAQGHPPVRLKCAAAAAVGDLPQV